MRSDPLLFEENAYAFARNMQFREGNAETRPSIEYIDLQVEGQFQGAEWVTPDRGISAQSYSMAPTALALAVNGETYLAPTNDGEFGSIHKLDACKTIGNVNFIDAENHLIILDGTTAQWWSGGCGTTKSPGFMDCPRDFSHDTFKDGEHENYIPHQAYTGVYTDGRVLVAVRTKADCPLGQDVSAIWVSDPLGKRGCLCHSGDLLLMEEQMRPSMGAPLVHPSRMGATVVLSVMPGSGNNGDDLTIDFALDGASTHTVLVDNREARIDGEGREIREGWDSQQLSNHGVLQSISAVSRYSQHDTPKDIIFQSEHGLHFVKSVLGDGSFNDETTNHLSHDIQPLNDIDENKTGNTVGHWVRGNRFFTSLGLRQDEHYTSSAAGRGFGSLNQATRFTRDRTPNMEWEGLWEPDEDIWGIHKFTRGGERKTSKTYGFVASDNSRKLYYGKLNTVSNGLDSRDGEEIPIDWEIWTKAFSIDGLTIENQIIDGHISVEVDETTRFVAVDIWSDRCQRWEEWSRRPCSEGGRCILKHSLGKPHEDIRDSIWFQFRIRGEGWANIRTMTAEYVKTVNEVNQPDRCDPLKREEPSFFRDQ